MPFVYLVISVSSMCLPLFPYLNSLVHLELLNIVVVEKGLTYIVEKHEICCWNLDHKQCFFFIKHNRANTSISFLV
jgi:hypothetical protein